MTKALGLLFLTLACQATIAAGFQNAALKAGSLLQRDIHAGRCSLPRRRPCLGGARMQQGDGDPEEKSVSETVKGLKASELKEYYKGFITEDREDASQLDNLTPNIKFGIFATVALVGMVSAFVVSNPPPSKDTPLPPLRNPAARQAAAGPNSGPASAADK